MSWSPNSFRGYNGSLGQEHRPPHTSDYSISLSVSLQSRPPASAQRILTPADSVTSTLEDQLSFNSLSRELLKLPLVSLFFYNLLEHSLERVSDWVCMCYSVFVKLGNGRDIDVTRREKWRRLVLHCRTRAFGRIHMPL